MAKVKDKKKKNKVAITKTNKAKKSTPKKAKVKIKKVIKPKKPVKTQNKKKVIAKKVVTKKKTSKKVLKKPLAKKTNVFNLERFQENPIISPKGNSSWESKATFNPAALFSDGKIHLLYRAIGDDDVSVLGYAVSSNGFDVDEKLPYPAYSQNATLEDIEKTFSTPLCYGSGGGWSGGCEDPRLALIDNDVFLTYTAFDGWGSIRMALSSISLKDFCKRNWKWKRPVFISPPGEVHKNWVLFPEKINGKYAVLHSISPYVLIDYVDNLKEFDGTKFIRSYYHGRSGRKEEWDNWVRGAGPTPIKTKYGWLVLYHAMDDGDPNRYKLGAMLLDLNDTTKILFRSKSPFLEPDETYENDGLKAGVVYCCGAVVSGEQLFIYYGGADTVTCAASINLEKFLRELMTIGTSSVQKKTDSKTKGKKK